MPFTVARTGGTPGMEFEWYARLLHSNGFDLSDLPRIPEPGIASRWLCVWDTEQQAREFADELPQRSGDAAWQVLPVEAPVSRGPLGPIELQFGRQADGIGFDLHPLSRQMIRNRFPSACRIDWILLGINPPSNFRPAGEELYRLAGQAMILLTGLSPEELALFGGFRVIDPVARREVSPRQAIQGVPVMSSVVADANGGSISQALR